MTNDPELILVDRILAGETHLFAQMVDRYKGYTFTIVYKILLNRPEAEEAAQDAFIKAFHHLAGFNRQSKFSTWLYRIAFNTAISYKRKHRRPFENIENVGIAVAELAHQNLETTDKKKYLAQGLRKLTEGDRTALTLFYWKEFSLEEMAEIMSTPANTLKVRLHRARQKLADELAILLKEEAVTL
jgi:RNA polymerase sigma-70 factor (ECF subfamily)